MGDKSSGRAWWGLQKERYSGPTHRAAYMKGRYPALACRSSKGKGKGGGEYGSKGKGAEKGAQGGAVRVVDRSSPPKRGASYVE